MNKRTQWISLGIIGALGMTALIMGQMEIAALCAGGIIATLNNITEK
jgi:hypothetical protein